MPELPEVELYCRYFAAHATGRKVSRVIVHDERILGEIRAETFRRRLQGRTFGSVTRHGKHLFARASRSAEKKKDQPEVWLHLHFGMTGDLALFEDEPPRFTRVSFEFETGRSLAYEDMRLFGVVDLSAGPAQFVEEHELGPDPLARSFTLAAFRRLFDGRRGAVKSLFMSQEVIAGIGNLYADEILYATGIDPRRAVDTLDPSDVRRLFAAMQRILRQTIERKAKGAGYPSRWLIPHREEGDRCPRCGGSIRRTVVFGRTTYFCGEHQT